MKGGPTASAGRKAAQAAVMSSLRQAARGQNRKFTRQPGIASSSVFQQTKKSPELKFLDLATTPTASLAGNGSLTFLNGCAQGTDANQHIGRQTTMKSVYWIFQAIVAATTTLGGSMRLLIVYDKEAEGAAPTIATGAQTDICNIDDITAQMNLNNRDRFVVISDEMIETIGTAGPQAVFRKGYRKVALPVVFNASAAATIAAINTGSVYAIVWQNGLATAAATTKLQTRIRFTDN